MEQIIIAKAGVAYGAKVGGGTVSNMQDAVNLVEGGIAVFTENGALVASDATSVAKDSLIFAVKRSGDLKLSFPIYREGYTKSEVAYAAPTAKIVAIGSNTNAGTTYNLNAPSTLVAGQDAVVVLTNLELNHDDQRRTMPYVEPVVSGDTIITVMARLLARVNADTKKLATMSKIDTTNSDGYLFTGTAGVNFSVACEGILANADVLEVNEIVHAGTAGVNPGYVSSLTNLAAHSKGVGTAAQIAEAEDEASVREGNTKERGWKTDVYTQPSAVVAGETYNQIIVSSTRPNDNVLIPRLPLRKQVHLVIPESDDNYAIMQNITTVFITPSA